MNKIISLTWKNLIIIIFLFYLIGDLFLGIKNVINQKIREYEIKRNIEAMRYMDQFKLDGSGPTMYTPSFLKNDSTELK